MTNPFTDKDGVFSMRKGLAAMSAVLFFYCAIARVSFNANALPLEYTAIIAGVFAFYFGKDLFAGKKLELKDSNG